MCAARERADHVAIGRVVDVVVAFVRSSAADAARCAKGFENGFSRVLKRVPFRAQYLPMSSAPSRLQAMLVELESALSTAGIRHAIAGGIAMAAHGRVRATDDIDVLADAAQADALREVMRRLGYAEEVHGPVPTRFVRRPMPGLPGLAEWVDALFASRPSGRGLIERAAAHPVRWNGVSLPVVDAAGLVLMKCIALVADPQRHVDADDVRYLLSVIGEPGRVALVEDASGLGADVAAVLGSLVNDGVREAPLGNGVSRL